MEKVKGISWELLNSYWCFLGVDSKATNTTIICISKHQRFLIQSSKWLMCDWCFAYGFISFLPFTQKYWQVLASAYISSNRHKHTSTHTDTCTPCGAKAPLCFYGFAQWGDLLGWTVTTLLCFVCVCLCAQLCARSAEREGLTMSYPVSGSN